MEIASRGVSGAGGPLPHLEQIQASFGHHDVSDVTAHQGPAAAEASRALGAQAFAIGNAVAFGDAPDLHTTAHEAAHVVQQRSGVHLKGGIDGGANDPHERHADQVADAVVAGQPAEALLDQMAGGTVGSSVVQRNPQPAAIPPPDPAHVPARGGYLVELTPDGGYAFIFNSFDVHKWSEPAFTALRYYMQQVFPGVGDSIIRNLFQDLNIHLGGGDPVPAADDQMFGVHVRADVHQSVIAWMKVHQPGMHPHTPRLGGDGLHQGDAGAGDGKQRGGRATTKMAADGRASQDRTSIEIEQTRVFYEQLRKSFPEATELRGHAAWPDFLAFVAEHPELKPLLHGGNATPSVDDLRRVLAQFQQQQVKDGDSDGGIDRHADGRHDGGKAGTADGDIREQKAGGINDGSIYGDADGAKYGWIRWVPEGQVQIAPRQPSYVAGSSVRVELAWDLSVHPEAGLILLPNHCTYQWTVRHGGKAIDSAGHSVFADDRHATLDLGAEPGTYEIEVTASSKHFKTEHRRFSSSVVINAISEKAFDQSTFDSANITNPDAAFSRDGQGRLHLQADQKAQTTEQEISSLDLSKGGIDALAKQGKITGDDRDVLVEQIKKQRAALVKIQDKTKHGTPYIVRGTFVSREDSSALPLHLLMHVLRRTESGGVAFYELILHDTTFGSPNQHPGSSSRPIDNQSPAVVYSQLEGEALDGMAAHFHSFNDYPRGTIHLAVQQLTSDAVWEKTLDTDNGRKAAKRIVGTVAAVGGIALMVVPGGSVVSAGLLVVTSTAAIASVAMELEHRREVEGHLTADRRLAMDVLQVVAVALPFGTLTRTFATASRVGKSGFLLCMTSLDIAQGFLIATDVRKQLDVIEAGTTAELAGATSDEQRKQIYAERDRQVAEIIGGAVVNGSFLLVSLGHGIKNTIATTRGGVRFSVREPVRDLVKQGREPMQTALASDTFEHDSGRVQLTPEERRYLEHEIAAPEVTDRPTSNATSSAQEHAAPNISDRHRAHTSTDDDATRVSGDSAHEPLSVLPAIQSFEQLGVEQNRIVGHPVPSAQARDILRAVVAGDPAALTQVGLTGTPRLPKVQSIEFGIGRTTDGLAVVVCGEQHAVDWSKLPGVVPDGHTHPSVKANDIRPTSDGNKVSIHDLVQPTAVPLLNRELVFPSADDFILMSQLGIDGHRVFTPYVVIDEFVMKAPGNAGPRLEFEIGKPTEIGVLPNGQRVHHATLVGVVGQETVIHKEVWIVQNAQDASGHLYMAEPQGMATTHATGPTSALPGEAAPQGRTRTTANDPPLASRSPAEIPSADLANLHQRVFDHVKAALDGIKDPPLEVIDDLTKAGRDAAEHAYREKRGTNAAAADARKYGGDAAKRAIKERALTEAETLACRRAASAIADGTVFDLSKLPPDAKTQLADFGAGRSGGIAKRMAAALVGKDMPTMEALLDGELAKGGGSKTAQPGPDPIDRTATQSQQLYQFDDGTLIRIKPRGDQFHRGVPMFSIEVKQVAPSDALRGQGGVAFKVNNQGQPVPKGTFEIANPYDRGRYQLQNKIFEQTVLDESHQQAVTQ